MFGATAASQAQPFSFGSSTTSGVQQQPLFGAAPMTSTTPATSLFSSFGQPTSTFAAPATTTTSNLFGLASTSTASNLFGAPQLKTAAPASSAGTLFSFPAATSTTVASLQQPQSQVISHDMQMSIADIGNFVASLTNPQVFGGDRDSIVAKFNQLQAFCGQGKGVVGLNQPLIDYTPANPFCRFKAICYNALSSHKDEDGFLSLIFKKPDTEVKAVLQKCIDDLFLMLGGKPQLKVNVEAVKPLPDNKSELIIYITETGMTGISRKILSSEAYAYFNQSACKQHLSNMLVEQVLLKCRLPEEKMQEYLAIPRDGVEMVVWNQAIADNPDSKRLIPQVILGFNELLERQKLQKAESDIHVTCIQELSKRLDRLEEQTLQKQSQLDELKSKHSILSNRLVTIVGRCLSHLKRGMAFESDEEMLKSKLDAISSQINGSNQLQNRLMEVQSSMLNKPQLTGIEEEKIDEDLQLEIKQYLKKCQDSIEMLTTTIRQDKQALKTMQNSLFCR